MGESDGEVIWLEYCCLHLMALSRMMDHFKKEWYYSAVFRLKTILALYVHVFMMENGIIYGTALLHKLSFQTFSCRMDCFRSTSVHLLRMFMYLYFKLTDSQQLKRR